MALNIPEGTQDGDILDPSDYMDDGWCYTVDCVDRMNYVSWTTNKEAWEARLLEGNFCHVGSHNNTNVASSYMSMGTGEEPTCDEIYEMAEAIYKDYDYGDGYWYHGSSLATATRLGKIVNLTLTGCGAVVIGNGYTADNPCGQYNITDPNPYWISNNWRGVANITGLNMEYHAQDAGSWECPPNSCYNNGTCIPHPGYEAIDGEIVPLPGSLYVSSSINIVTNEVDCTEIIRTINDCSDLFFWEELTCDAFFAPEEYTKFEIKIKGG